MKENPASGKQGKSMRKTMGVASVFAICTGAAFSSGFFLLPGFAADITGPSLPIVFAIAGLLMLPAIFSISELSSAMPRSGGPYYFITRSFGPLTGIIGTIGIYLQWLMKGAFAFVGVGYYLSLIYNIPVQPLAIGLIIFFTLVNLVGVKQTSITEIILVAVLIIVLSIFVVAGAMEVLPRLDEAATRFTPLFPHGIEGLIAALALVFVSFGGMGQVASLAGEIKNPSRAIPQGMLISLAVVTFFYLTGTGTIVALVDREILHDNPAPVAEAAAQFHRFPLPVIVIVIAALAAFTSTGNAVILSAARYPLALSRDQLLWGKFSKINKKGIPVNSVLVTGAILLLLVLLFDVEEIAKLASGFLLFTFIGMCLSVIIFRESNIQEYKPGYKTPLYPWVQIVGIVIYAILIFFSGWEILLFIVGICLAGVLWFYKGLREKSSFSAAVYPMLQRIAGEDETNKRDLNRRVLQEDQLSSVVDHAIVITLDKKVSFDEILDRSSAAVTERLGGDKDEMKRHLNEQAKHMLHPVDFNISVAPALISDIEQPEMVIVKGKIEYKDQIMDGFIILLDDHDSSERLFNLVSRLDASLHRKGFFDQWNKAQSSKEIKKSLQQNIRSFTFTIDKNTAPDWIDKKIHEIGIPEGSIVAVLQRKENVFVPGPDTRLEHQDVLTVIAETDAYNQLLKQLGENTGSE